ncbi:ankyrin repeat protein [Colletotrichum asianum]|uniref:Ankyrin repeat protein n=1 Tax=Colletotrichum asianum TaxID=702518 RepID=A0A8H3ZES2_9PEZI|nr:ankyrin repeat protein [Colletotrichum asianum]
MYSSAADSSQIGTATVRKKNATDSKGFAIPPKLTRHFINPIQHSKKCERTLHHLLTSNTTYILPNSYLNIEHRRAFLIMTDRQNVSASHLVALASRQELPPAKQTDIASRAHLLELPAEIILQIVDAIFNSDLKSLRKGYDEPEDRFSIWRTAIRLAKTCKALNYIVTPAIYQADIKWNRGSSLLLGAKTGSASTIQKALEAGAEIDMWDFTELYDDFFELQQSMSNRDVTRNPTEIDMTALHWAAYHRNVDAITVLLEHGANVRTTGALGPHSQDILRFACAAWFRVVSYFKKYFPILQKGEYRTWLDYILQGLAEGKGPNVLYYALT